MSSQPDPLGVLRSTAVVMRSARHVAIDSDAIDAVAERISDSSGTASEWDDATHWTGEPDATANYVLVLDALNFCFWGEPRWRVTINGATVDGYYALAAALRRALDDGVPLTDARCLARIPAVDVAAILRGEHVIPLFSARVQHLREVGSVLLDRWDGQFLNVVEEAGGSATRLAAVVADQFTSFRDVTNYDGHVVRFYKRAQILASDLAGSFNFKGPGALADLDQLTAFADYKVPQVLHHLGVLQYDTHITTLLQSRTEIARGSREEIEIRAATIQGVEQIRRRLVERHRSIPTFEIDWHLWNLGQSLAGDVLPYHRTRTIDY
jgi:hypothetical protein